MSMPGASKRTGIADQALKKVNSLSIFGASILLEAISYFKLGLSPRPGLLASCSLPEGACFTWRTAELPSLHGWPAMERA